MTTRSLRACLIVAVGLFLAPLRSSAEWAPERPFGPDQDGRIYTYLFGPMYCEEGVFRHGAYVKAVYGPKDTFSRTVSLKMLAVKNGETISENLGIIDLTDCAMEKAAGWTLIHQLPIPLMLYRTFPLDPRVQGTRQYTLGIDGGMGRDAHITFGRPFNTEQISVTETLLLRKRAEQAVDEGYHATINGQNFLTLRQIDANMISLLFFKGDLAEKLDSHADGDLSPVLMADITIKWDGSKPKLRPLGQIGNKYYYLERDESGAWRSVAGEAP